MTPTIDERKAGEPLDRLLARRLRWHRSGSTITAPLRSDGSGPVQLIEERVSTEDVQDRETLPCGVMPDPTAQRWAASGLMALTGSVAQPLGPPSGLLERLDQLAAPFPELDALALLGERASLMGLWRRGSTSCGGSCHLLPSSAGWVAVSLPRRRGSRSHTRLARGLLSAEDGARRLVSGRRTRSATGDAAGVARASQVARAPVARTRRGEPLRDRSRRDWEMRRLSPDPRASWWSISPPSGRVRSAATCWLEPERV